MVNDPINDDVVIRILWSVYSSSINPIEDILYMLGREDVVVIL